MSLDWANLVVRVVYPGRVRCEPSWSLGRSWSNQLYDYDLWYVWAGRGSICIDGKPLALQAGVCLWARPGVLYLADHDVNDRLGVSFCHFTLEHVNGTVYPRDGPPPGLPPIVHHIHDVPYADGVMRRVVDLTERDDAQAADALLRGLLIDIDHGHHAPAPEMPTGTALHHRQVVLQAAAMIRESPGDAPSIGELAAKAGYSSGHFARVFNKVLHITPQAYIVQQRIARARALLRESPLTINQIADALGYRDVFFFSRAGEVPCSPPRCDASRVCGMSRRS